MAVEDIRAKADEVAALMAARFGGVRRGHQADLSMMLRRRGGALPRKLRREARLLARADRHLDLPKIGRTLDEGRMAQAHRALLHHLRPFGKGERWKGRALNIAATVAFGLMLLGAVAVWVLVRRGIL